MEGSSDHHRTQPCSAKCFSSYEHPGFYYGVDGDQNAGFYSDGSLCLMEAFNRSQKQATVTSTPKLEDFFGGGTMGTRHYEGCDRGRMILNYKKTENKTNNVQDFQSHDQEIQVQEFNHCTAIKGQEMYQASDTEPKETHLPTMANEGISAFTNWVARHYQSSHALEQKMGIRVTDNGGESGQIGEMGHGDFQTLSLSMSTASQTNCVFGSQHITTAVVDCMGLPNNKRGPEKVDERQIVHRKSIDSSGKRTSHYRGVTRHRWTGRYEAHLWDNSCKKEGRSRKGRQVYLGGYDIEEKAAKAYDLAALKFWGPSSHINFRLENYQQEFEDMKNMSRQEYVAHLRRKSSGFSRGASIYRGVTRHHQHGRWQARIGRVAGNKDLYLGTFSTQEEAAEAYDIAAIKIRGTNAITNFDISTYDVERILGSNTLLSSEMARKNTFANSNNSSNTNNTVDSSVSKESSSSNVTEWTTALCHSSNLKPVEDLKVSNFSVPADLPENPSLSSSRIDSRDGDNTTQTDFATTQPVSKYFRVQTNTVNSRYLGAQMRPRVSFFAAWTDAS